MVILINRNYNTGTFSSILLINIRSSLDVGLISQPDLTGKNVVSVKWFTLSARLAKEL